MVIAGLLWLLPALRLSLAAAFLAKKVNESWNKDEHSALIQSTWQGCNGGALQQLASPVFQGALSDSELCMHAMLESQCVAQHYKAFAEAVRTLGAHGLTSAIPSMFESLYTMRDVPAEWLRSSGSSRGRVAGFPTPNGQPHRQHLGQNESAAWLASMMEPRVFFRVLTNHSRHDPFSPRCSSGQQLVSTWARNLRFQRFVSDTWEKELPANVAIRSKKEYVRTVSSVLDPDRSVFTFLKQAQLHRVQQAVRDLDWESVLIHCYATMPDPNGEIFSPAFNSLYIAWHKETGQLSHFMIIAADGSGGPATKYLGVEFGEEIESMTNWVFTPLSDRRNLFSAAVEAFDPTAPERHMQFSMRVWYKDHPPPAPAYITVTSTFDEISDPTASEPMVLSVAAKLYYTYANVEAYCGTDATCLEAQRPVMQSIQAAMNPKEHLEACVVSPRARDFLTGRAPLLSRLAAALSKDPNTWAEAPHCRAEQMRGDDAAGNATGA